jgi:transposase
LGVASLQQKKSGKYKYWYIVESRRVNGKPRPVVLAYLGTADALLRKLQGLDSSGKVKSYSHGTVAPLLDMAAKLHIPAIINAHVQSTRPYMAAKPIRNELTVGMTLVLGAIGMVCMPTSKRGWWQWAKTTSLEYMLRCALSKVDSQHFWDSMDALPVEAIEKIEQALLKRVKQAYSLASDTLYFDTTNFFTFIATTNERCTLAQRGKNKQKRGDLRQVGLAMVVTPKDYVPLFHLTYQGNRNDSKVFKEVLGTIKERMLALEMDVEKHTLVFDRGNNSKKNMALVAEAKMHYVGALTPYHHKRIGADAEDRFEPLTLNGQELSVYRAKETIWGEERTVLVFISDRLKTGQLRGAYKSLENKQKELQKIKRSLEKPRKKPLDKAQLQAKIEAIAKGQFITGIIEWSLRDGAEGNVRLDFEINQDKLDALEDKLGFRILMTDRHDWNTAKIIQAFYGQSFVEHAFKNIKNPYHLTLKPQHHWTDQKIRVHYFMGVLGYLMSTLIWKHVKENSGYTGTLDNLLDSLNNIRLAALIETKKGRGKPRVTYQLEQMDTQESALVEALGIGELHTNRPKISQIGVYAD